MTIKITNPVIFIPDIMTQFCRAAFYASINKVLIVRSYSEKNYRVSFLRSIENLITRNC